VEVEHAENHTRVEAAINRAEAKKLVAAGRAKVVDSPAVERAADREARV
jgi:hypothetical protein